MSIIKITAKDQDLVCTQKPIIAAQGVNEDTVEFSFSDEWEGMEKVALFFNVKDRDTVLTSVLDANNAAVVPWEVTAEDGAMYIGVYGTTGDTIYTSNLLRYQIEKGIYTPGSQSEEPTPDIIRQLLSAVGGVWGEIENLRTADTATNARIDELIGEHGAGVTQTLLFGSGTDTSIIAKYRNETFTLADAIENYDFILVRAVVADQTYRYIFPAGDFELQADYAMTAYNPIVTGYAFFRATISGTTMTVGITGEYRNTGSSRTAYSYSEDSHPTSNGIFEIRGINFASAAELNDIRVAYDGTTYGSAGEAVRKQIENTQAIASAADESIRQSIEERDGYEIVVFEPGGYYPVGTVGAVVDLTTFTASANYLHAFMACTEGDRFTVNIHGGSGGARAYAWLNADREVLSRTNANMNVSGVLTAPANASYLVINTKTAEPDFFAFRGTKSVIDTAPTEGSTNAVQSGGAFVVSDRIEKAVGEYSTDITPAFTTGQVWKIVDGKAENTAVSRYAAFDAVTVTPGEKFSMVQQYNGNSNYASAVAVDSDNNILAAYSGSTSVSETIEFYIPEGATQLLLSSTEATAATVVLQKITLAAGASLGTFAYPGKNIAIIGDSISTNGNYSVTNPQGNMPEIVIGAEDIGVSLSAYATYYDIGTTVGGHTITAEDVGTEITFTPTADDVGKFVGVPKNNNSAATVVWWEVAQERLGFNAIPVCWSGSSVTSHEGETAELKTSYAWHPAQIRKCGIRVPGTMDRTAPDMIILYRGTNDFSHAPYTRLTEDYFGAGWTYPDTDVITDGFGFLEGICLTVKKLREAYPEARIVLCTLNYFQRFNSTRPGYPTRNGLNTLNQYNNAIRAAADWLGCGLIEFDKDGLTFENASGDYYNETSGNFTHPNTAGQRFLGMRAINDLNRVND